MANTPVVDTLKQEDFPLKIYLFNEDGKYDPRKVIDIYNIPMLRTAMCEVVAPHFRRKLEVRITDSGDMCLFHCENGVIIHPKEAVNGVAIDGDANKQPKPDAQLDNGSVSAARGGSSSDR